MTKPELQKALDKSRKEMQKAAKEMDFLLAARLRDEMFALEKVFEERFENRAVWKNSDGKLHE